MQKLLCVLFVFCVCSPAIAQDDFFSPPADVPVQVHDDAPQRLIDGQIQPAERVKIIDMLRELRESNKNLRSEMKESRATRKKLLDQLSENREKRREEWKEWRRETQELWNARFKALIETQGPVRQTLTLLVRLFLILIIFIGIVSLAVIGFWFWGKISR